MQDSRRVTYDSKAKALYIYLQPKGDRRVTHTFPSPDGESVYWDLDEQLNVLGVEFLNVELEDITERACVVL